MKFNKLIILAVALFFYISVSAQRSQPVTMVRIKSLPHFFENIQSNKKLILNLEHYKLQDVLKMAKYDPVSGKLENIKGKRYEVIFTSFTTKDSAGVKVVTDAEFYIEINWIENFQIVGRKTDDGITKVTSSSLHNNLFVFKKSKNILLRNFRMGHWPEKGYCDGDVITFEDCENITIDNCEIFGSGVTGLIADKVKQLKVKETIIEECTFDIMHLRNTTDATFNNCTFQNTEGQLEIFNMDDYKNIDPIEFNECTFSGLKLPVFALDITEYETIKVNNCLFYGIEEEKLSNEMKKVEQVKNKFKKAKK